MVAWLDYLERSNPDYLRVNDLRNNYGDWLCIPSDREFRTHSPMKDLLATAYWAEDARKLAEMARALDKGEEADRFERMHARVRQAFQRTYLRPDGSLTVDTQTAALLALAFDLVPENLRGGTATQLVQNLHERDDHLSTGFIGIRFLNPILSLHGHNDLAYKLLTQEGYPSWLYPVKHGATTIWERWNGWTEEDGFFDPLMNSFNHYSLGSVGEWLFRHVAGIDADPQHSGFQHFILRPSPGPGLRHACAHYESLHGRIRSSWQIHPNEFCWQLTIPPNCSAQVSIPARPEATVTVDGQPLNRCPYFHPLHRDEDHLSLHASAGEYHFHVTPWTPVWD